MKTLSNISHIFQIPKITHKRFYILPLTERDLDECLNMIQNSFKKDPLLNMLNISSEKMLNFARLGFQRSIDEQLAFICRDSENSKIIGSAVFVDQYNRLQNPIDYGKVFASDKIPNQEELGRLGEKVNSILMKHKSFTPAKPYEILYNSYLFIDNDYSAQKISKELVNFFVHGHPIGSKAALVYRESVTPRNEKLLKRLGWEKLAHLSWKKLLGYSSESKEAKFIETKAQELGYSEDITIMGFKRN